MKRTFSVAALLMVFANTTVAQTTPPSPAIPPITVSFQVHVVRQDNTPISDGTHTLTVKIYDAQAGGSQRWSEQETSISTNNGNCTLRLGTTQPISSSALSGSLWVEISENGTTFLRQSLPATVQIDVLNAEITQNNSETTKHIDDLMKQIGNLEPGKTVKGQIDELRNAMNDSYTQSHQKQVLVNKKEYINSVVQLGVMLDKAEAMQSNVGTQLSLYQINNLANPLIINPSIRIDLEAALRRGNPTGLEGLINTLFKGKTATIVSFFNSLFFIRSSGLSNETRTKLQKDLFVLNIAASFESDAESDEEHLRGLQKRLDDFIKQGNEMFTILIGQVNSNMTWDDFKGQRLGDWNDKTSAFFNRFLDLKLTQLTELEIPVRRIDDTFQQTRALVPTFEDCFETFTSILANRATSLGKRQTELTSYSQLAQDQESIRNEFLNGVKISIQSTNGVILLTSNTYLPAVKGVRKILFSTSDN